MIVTIRNKRTNIEATAPPAFLTKYPKGLRHTFVIVVERNRKEILVDCRDYEMFHDGVYIDLLYAEKEGFLEPIYLKYNTKKFNKLKNEHK